MSKLRSVSTAFWSDPFIEDLTPSQKLLFLYLITNEKTNMLGIYEASSKKIAFETGIPLLSVQKDLAFLEKAGKVKHVNNFIVLINFMKHQNFNTNMKKSAIDVYNNLPKELKHSELNLSKDDYSVSFESLLNHYGMVPNHTAMVPKVEREYEYEYEREYEVKVEVEKEKKEGLILPYQSEDFKKAWEILVNEPKWRKKSTHALSLSLEKLGGYSEIIAIKMIKDCIGGNWQGLVEPKTIFKKPENPHAAVFNEVGRWDEDKKNSPLTYKS